MSIVEASETDLLKLKGGYKEKLHKMVNSPYLSDVTFAVGSEGKLMYAHRLLLTHFSEVFSTMFNGNFIESRQKRPIVVNDIEPNVFLEMLYFIYCDRCDMTGDNVLDILYAATKYMLYELEKKCETFLTEHMDLGMLLTAFINDSHTMYPRMHELCIKKISNNPLPLFKHPVFLNIPCDQMEIIAKMTTIRCSDHQLLDAIDRWKEHQQNANQDEINRIRQIVQERIDDVSVQREYDGKRLSLLKPISERQIPYFLGRLVACRDLYLYGMGVYTGVSKSVPDILKVVTNIKISFNGEYVVKESLEIQLTDDEMDVQDCFFSRILLRKGQTVELSVSISGMPFSHQQTWYGCARKGVRCINNDDLQLRSEDNRVYVSPVAYMLYDLVE